MTNNFKYVILHFIEEDINDKVKESSRPEEGSKIKVVHFGLL